MYDKPFSVTEILQLFKMEWFLLANSSLQFQPYCSLIFLFGFWAGQSFNTVIFSSAKFCCVACDLWHGVPSYKKISSLSKFRIKLSISNWTYLTQFKLTSILTNFLKTIRFYVSPKHQANTHKPFSSNNMSCFTFWGSSDKFSLIRTQLHPSFMADSFPRICIP